MPTAAQREAAEERLRFDTPFWAGGVQKDKAGRWVFPAPGSFQGVAKILNKRKQIVPAIARPWQLELDEALEAQRAALLPMRVLILKARKLGFSTWLALKFLQRVTQMKYQMAVVVAQDNGTAGEILKMAKLAYSHLPTADEFAEWGFSIKPALIRVGDTENGRQHMVFGEPSRQLRSEGRTGESTFMIDTANSPHAGRGTTPNMLHLSEVAFWEAKQAYRKMLAMLEALPYEIETICAIESTANGLNHFHDRYMNAKQGSEDPDSGEVYTAIFVPWWRDRDCSRQFATADQRARFMESVGNVDKYGEVAEDERMLVELYGCTPEQLLWRRMKIQEQPDKSVATFNQENPHSDEAAFIGSGRTVFPGVLIARTINFAEAVEKPVEGTLRAVEVVERRTRAGMVEIPQRALWIPGEKMSAKDSSLLVWEHPRHAEDAPAELDGREATDFERRQGAYVLAGDIAGGEANTFSEGDYHAVGVFDHHTRMMVALHVSRMDIHLLPLWIFLIATYYNTARVAIEVNGVGIAVVDPLAKDYRYKRMYRREQIDTVQTHRVTQKAGWSTDKVTKPAMEANLQSLLDIEDVRGGIRDPQTARQLATYVRDEKGRTGATRGEYDDRLLMVMIAQMVMSLRPPPKIGGKRFEGFRPRDATTGY